MAKKVTTITKGKLLKSGKLNIEYQQENGSNEPDIYTAELPHVAHDDLKSAFASLTLHACIMNEFVEFSSEEEFEAAEDNERVQKMLEKFSATGFTISRKSDKDYLVLTANRTNRNGKVWMFNTPAISIDEDQEEPYEFLVDLLECLKDVRKEIDAYLKGKFAPNAQLKLEMEEQDN